MPVPAALWRDTTAQGHAHPSFLPLFCMAADCLSASASMTAPCTPAAPAPWAHHLVSGPGALALESVKLPSVVNGDEQLPEPQQDDADQHHAADH